MIQKKGNKCEKSLRNQIKSNSLGTKRKRQNVSNWKKSLTLTLNLTWLDLPGWVAEQVNWFTCLKDSLMANF